MGPARGRGNEPLWQSFAGVRAPRRTRDARLYTHPPAPRATGRQKVAVGGRIGVIPTMSGPNRHHSNPSSNLKALLDGVLGALNEPDRDEHRSERRNIKRPESPVGHRHRRHNWVQTAVIAVLERRCEPMQARDVHAAVEALLSEPVRWGSVKACLAANVAGSPPRFVRVAPGRYAMGTLPIAAGADPRERASGVG